MCDHNSIKSPDDERTQPLEILTPADLACDRWMQHGKQQAEKRNRCRNYEPSSRVSTNCRNCGGTPGSHYRNKR